MENMKVMKPGDRVKHSKCGLGTIKDYKCRKKDMVLVKFDVTPLAQGKPFTVKIDELELISNCSNETKKEFKMLDVENLPMPRLQIRWEMVDEVQNKWTAHYELVIPLNPYDGRREDGRNYIAVPFGTTKVTSAHSPIKNGKVSTPFRDGVHIKWDQEKLKLPAFAIYGDRVTQIYSKANEIASVLQPFADLLENPEDCKMEANGMIQLYIDPNDVRKAQELLDRL